MWETNPPQGSKTEFRDCTANVVIGLVHTPAINPGESRIVTANWYTANAKKGNHTIIATADKTLLASESNENNNTRNTTVYIQGNRTK